MNNRNPLDVPGQVFDLELMNPNPTSSKTKAGPVYRVSFEVERESWDRFMDTDTSGMIIAAKAAVVNMDEGQELHEVTQKPKKGEFGQYAKALRLSGFFRAPDVWKALGSDQDFLDWLKLQECAYGHDDYNTHAGECNGDVVPAHVRRVSEGFGASIKADFSAIPLCVYHHGEQHQHGESALGGRKWFDKKRIQYVQQWAWERLKETFGVESMSMLEPNELYDWCVWLNLVNYLPNEYKNYINME